MAISQKLKTEIQYDPTVMPQCIQPKNMKSVCQRDIAISVSMDRGMDQENVTVGTLTHGEYIPRPPVEA